MHTPPDGPDPDMRFQLQIGKPNILNLWMLAGKDLCTWH